MAKPLSLARGGVEDEGGEQGHAAVGAGHGEALVVGARDEQRELIGVALGLDGELALGSAGDVDELDVLHESLGNLNGGQGLRAVAGTGELIGVALGLDGELALGSAGDVDELDVLHESLGNLNGGQGLRAVAGTGKGDDHGGLVGVQEVARSGHDVGGRDGLEVVQLGVTSVTQVRSAGVADVVGGAGTGEHDGEATLAHGASLGQEGLDGLEVLLVDAQSVKPQLGLLLDLGGGVEATNLVELVSRHLEH